MRAIGPAKTKLFQGSSQLLVSIPFLEGANRSPGTAHIAVTRARGTPGHWQPQRRCPKVGEAQRKTSSCRGAKQAEKARIGSEAVMLRLLSQVAGGHPLDKLVDIADGE